MSSAQIDLATTNFDDIETSLIEWLKSRPEWADYDFTVPGSASALLIDICAGVAYKQNVQSNFALNERFLTTARLRSNVLRRAKELNYTAHSAISATANLILTFTPDIPVDFVVIPAGTRFQANGIDTTYTFTTLSTYTALKENDYTVEIEVVQGDYLTYEWTVSQNQKFFVIPNPDVDVSRLKVSVKDTSSDMYWTEYTRNYNIVNNDAESTIYFVEEIDKQYFRVYFGDGYISKAVLPGNLVKVDYLVTAGSAANNIVSFQLMDQLDYDCELEVSAPSYGGQDLEEIESIKRYAPLAFYSQNRAVTIEDYEYIIKSRFPQISSVNVWGGEDNTPPLYGRVCISAMTGGNYVLSDNLKEAISNVFDDNKIIGSKRLSWFNPEITQILTNLKIFYNPAFTVETPTTLRVLIQNSLLEYEKRINKFRSTFNYSDFISFIKGLDRSFIDLICDLSLNYSYLPSDYTGFQDINIQLNTKLKSNTLISTKYYNENNLLVYLKDDGYSTINEYTISETAEILTKSSIGTIDYSTGSIIITDLKINSLFQNDTLDIQVDPEEYNITAKFQNVFNINPAKSTIEFVNNMEN